jgi:ADP-ribose pyrophosphatase YjhB (NUDIX family)
MTVTRRSERAVASILRDLEERYGDVRIVEKTWTHPRPRYRTIVERFEDETLGGAGVWLTNDAGEVLLVRNEGDDGWADPGGKVEGGETYEAAAKRELREETGVDCRLTDVREVHVIENRPAEGDEPPVVEAIVIFDDDRTGGEIRACEGEIAAVDWFATQPETVLYDEVATRPYPASE